MVLTRLYFCLVALFVAFGACASFAVRFGACRPLVCFARFVPIFSYDYLLRGLVFGDRVLAQITAKIEP